MSEREICESYHRAKRPERQIQILADLTDTTPVAIQEVLRRNGLLPAPPTHQRPSSLPPTHPPR